MSAHELQNCSKNGLSLTGNVVKQDPKLCATDDENVLPKRTKKSKQSLDYVLRSGLAGGAAGCAVCSLF